MLSLVASYSKNKDKVVRTCVACSSKIKTESRIKVESGIKTSQCVYIFENEDLIVSIYPGMRAKSTPCFNCQ